MSLTAVLVLGVMAGWDPAAAPRSLEPAACQGHSGETLVREQLRRHHDLDAHTLTLALTLFCPEAASGPRWRLLDALAMLRLDERSRAVEALTALRASSSDPRVSREAAIVLAWAELEAGDRSAFSSALAQTAQADRARLLAASSARADAPADEQQAFGTYLKAALDERGQIEALAAHERLLSARHTRRPWVAVLGSALLPGAGQVYAGSWQAGAVAFVLNGAFIAGTVELARARLPFAAGLAGLGTGFVYVGNLISAGSLAQRRNDTAARPWEERMDALLLPETQP